MKKPGKKPPEKPQPGVGPGVAPLPANFQIAEFMKIDDLGLMFGLTGARLRQLEREGWFQRTARNSYRTAEVVRGVMASIRDETRRLSKGAAASRVQDMRAAEIALRIDEKNSRFIVEAHREAVDVLTEFAGPLRSALIGMAARVTNDLPLRKKIESHVDKAFQEAAGRAGKAAAHVDGAAGAIAAGYQGGARRLGNKQPDLPGKRGRPRTA